MFLFYLKSYAQMFYSIVETSNSAIQNFFHRELSDIQKNPHRLKVILGKFKLKI